jgi:sigma-B regulation protein RsbU (phosphoserine phosphatase)
MSELNYSVAMQATMPRIIRQYLRHFTWQLRAGTPQWRRSLGWRRSAADALRELNRKLHADLSSRDFVALCFSRYDPADGALEIANAGLPNPYALLRGDRMEELTAPGPRLPLGMRPDVRYESLRLTLEPGERVLFLTDGLPEAPTAPGEPLGYESLARLVGGITGTSEGFLEQLFESIHSVTSDSRDDDWTALLLERPKETAANASALSLANPRGSAF